MAFVYREERIIKLDPNNENELGPGQYISVDNKNKPESNAPFLSTSPKLKYDKKKNLPGPGEYYHDDIKEKVEKFKDKSFKGNNKATLIETIAKEFKNPNKENLGFMMKDQRFKVIQKEEVPGPGHYNKDKLLNKKDKKKSLAKIIHKRDMTRITSIPTKNFFGYEYNEEGEIVMKSDPDKEKKYLGIKKDTIGPGQYNIDNSNDWVKKGNVDWNKTLTKTIPREKIIEKKEFTEKDYKDVKKVQKEKLVQVIVDREERQRSVMRIMGQDKDHYSLIEKNIFNDQPGPGYYHNESTMSSFRPKTVPERFQAFGSNTERFRMTVNEDEGVGPGSYFKEFKKNKNIHYKQLHRIHSSSTMDKSIISGKKKTIDNFGFTSTTSRFTYKVKNKEVPGPGTYTNFKNPRKTFTANDCFGSLERRFVERKQDIITPGPGNYFDTEDNSNNNLLSMKKMLRKPVKNETFIIKKEKDKVPSVGTYDPDIIYSIQYKVSKNVNRPTMVDNSYEANKYKRFDNRTIDDSLLGPGYYYREKPIQKKQMFPPFNSKDLRFKENYHKNIGPGQYNQDGYFDWNKKTFNILYI